MKFFDDSSLYFHNIKAINDNVHWLNNLAQMMPNKQDTYYGSAMKYFSLSTRVFGQFFEAGTFPVGVQVIPKNLGDFMLEFVETLGIEPDEEIERFNGLNVTGGTYRYKIDNSYYYVDKHADYRGLVPYTHAHSPDTTVTDLFGKLWKMSGAVLYVSEELVKYNKKKTIRTINNGNQCGCLYGSVQKFIDDLISDYNKYCALSLPRSYLLVGDPGVGKTSLICEFVNRIGANCVFTSLDNDDPYDFANFFALLNPQVIVFDDCDRSSSDYLIRKQLKFIEEVKKALPKTTIFMVANKFDGALKDTAFTRKGRLDKIYEIPRPEVEDVKNIFRGYLAQFSHTVNAEDFDFAVSRMEKWSGAEIYNLVQELLVGADIREYFEYEDHVKDIRKKYEAEVKK
jgi:hypothetical protein